MEKRFMKAMAKINLSYLNAKKRVQEKLKNQDGSITVESVMGILIAIVVGGIIINLLDGSGIFQNILDTIEQAIIDIFGDNT